MVHAIFTLCWSVTRKGQGKNKNFYFLVGSFYEKKFQKFLQGPKVRKKTNLNFPSIRGPFKTFFFVEINFLEPNGLFFLKFCVIVICKWPLGITQ